MMPDAIDVASAKVIRLTDKGNVNVAGLCLLETSTGDFTLVMATEDHPLASCAGDCDFFKFGCMFSYHGKLIRDWSCRTAFRVVKDES